MFYHVSGARGGGEGRVESRSEARRRDEELLLAPWPYRALLGLHPTFPADLSGARDPVAPALLRPQPAQHGKAEALHRGGGDLHRQVSAAPFVPPDLRRARRPMLAASPQLLLIPQGPATYPGETLYPLRHPTQSLANCFGFPRRPLQSWITRLPYLLESGHSFTPQTFLKRLPCARFCVAPWEQWRERDRMRPALAGLTA